jgi:23S rRNA-/tRNA-specific pseudouridylate synthase
MKALGHPVVGDELYKSRRLKEKTKISRIFLHAAHLGFVDLCGKQQDYDSKLPIELKEFMKKIRN